MDAIPKVHATAAWTFRIASESSSLARGNEMSRRS